MRVVRWQPHDFAAELAALDPPNRVAPQELQDKHVSVLAEIGKGSFGTVYKALFDTQNAQFGEILVAVKELRAEATPLDKDLLCQECVCPGLKQLSFCAVVFYKHRAPSPNARCFPCALSGRSTWRA